jgi:hypothetical protein
VWLKQPGGEASASFSGLKTLFPSHFSQSKQKGREKRPCLFGSKPGIVKVLKVEVVRLD